MVRKAPAPKPFKASGSARPKKLTSAEGVKEGYGVRMFKSMGLERDDEAMEMLKLIAQITQPLMEKHKWVLPLLREFVPTDDLLLGVNINRGREIRLRLRPAGRTNTFYDREFVLGTMLHELAHNIRAPHDAQFYKAMDELSDELGAAAAAAGRTLGASGANAAAAAEQRARWAAIMLPPGGRRLGGPLSAGSSAGSSPASPAASAREMAARAAERRARDRVWCASADAEASADRNDDGGDDADVRVVGVRRASSSSAAPSNPVYVIDDDSDSDALPPQEQPLSKKPKLPPSKPVHAVPVVPPNKSANWLMDVFVVFLNQRYPICKL